MEQAHNLPRPLEYDDPERRRRLGRASVHVVFELFMQAVDAGELTRNDAIERTRSFRELLVDDGRGA